MPKATGASIDQRQPRQDESGRDDVVSEPISVFISDEWDIINEDFIDDFDDLGDVDFPTLDDDF